MRIRLPGSLHEWVSMGALLVGREEFRRQLVMGVEVDQLRHVGQTPLVGVGQVSTTALRGKRRPRKRWCATSSRSTGSCCLAFR